MRSLWILVPLLGACDNGKEEPTPEDTGPVEEDAPPLAPPYLGFVMAIDQSASALKSTCEFALDLVDEGGQTVASAEGGGNGRQWIGLPLEEN